MISVIIPTYNRAHCIRDAIDSVLRQTFQDFEIIIIDDASTDGTEDVVQNLLSEKVKYIKQSVNKGGGAARNRGIQESEGEYIAFLDSDDAWSPTYLERVKKEFDTKDETFGLVYCFMNIINSDGEIVAKTKTNRNGLAIPDLLINNFIASFSCVTLRKSALISVSGMDESFRSCQDWDLFVRVNREYKISCIADELVTYLKGGLDKHKISSSKNSIITGHWKMLSLIEQDLIKFGCKFKANVYKEFAIKFYWAASPYYVLRMIRRTFCEEFSFGNAIWGLAIFCRTLKKAMFKEVGY